MFTHTTLYRVPYQEVDRLNIVHHGHYAKYYEIGRLEAMRTLGWSYKDMEESGIGLYVAFIESKFLKPAHFDEIIQIITTISELPGRRITFKTEILNADNETCNIGTVKLLFVKRNEMKVCSMPIELRDLLVPYFRKMGE